MRSRNGAVGTKLNSDGAVEGRLDVMSPPKGDAAGVPPGVSSVVGRHVLISFAAGSGHDAPFCDEVTNSFWLEMGSLWLEVG